ncbi:ATP-binding protein [Stackebrandtia nassauensis]|uniref:ATP-binding protein n=1 Tax=Stackebrandtia nassauensis TaxID=283811 RepID=UPI0001A3A752|nr:LuxR C-terminal-related transcriptional regulator [Stackebrandtia nassauensis]
MTAPRIPHLSNRETEVLAALGAKLSNAQIAHRLRISVRTVESHVSSLLRKFGVTDRWALTELSQPGSPTPALLAGLPTARTSFVGRAPEREQVLASLSEARLVTLLGPGGVGKTRLAAEVSAAAAPDFPQGGAFVDLVPVRDGFVAQAVATALGVVSRPGQSLEDAICQHLRRGRGLLVLDNCEHLMDSAAGFAERVLSSCPDTTVLTTSRERLRLAGERAIPVPALRLESEAQQLFHDRALAADPGFAADPTVVAEICARLDGLPLAIELAAARSVSLGAAGLLDALDDALRLLDGGRDPDERHRSLRAVISWSFHLLDDDERALLCRLAVFVGGFDLDAAVAVATGTRGAVADVLGRLVEKSLVEHRSGRWRLLSTIRGYAVGKLADSGDEPEVRERHLRWAAELAADLVTRLDGEWRDEFDAVADDLRAAVAAAAETPSEVPHRLARSLGWLTYARRFLPETPDHFCAAARFAEDPGEAAEDLRNAADAAHAYIDTGRSYDLLLASAEKARAAGDPRAEAIALAFAVVTANRHPGGFSTEISGESLRELLDRAKTVGDRADPLVAAHLAAAEAWSARDEKVLPDPELLDEAIETATATGDPVLISAALDAACIAALTTGRFREAHRIGSRRVALLSEMPRNDPYSAPEITDTYHMASGCAVAAGDLPAALKAARSALADDLIGRQSYVAFQASIPPLVLSGDLSGALQQAPVLWDACVRAASPLAWMSPAVAAIALAHGLLGDAEQYRLWRERAEQVARPVSLRYLASFAAFVDARVAVHTDALGDAAEMVERAFAESPPQDWYRPYARAAGAELAIVAGLPDAAQRLAQARHAAVENDWATACLDRCAGRWHADEVALHKAVRGWERIGARFERATTLLLLPDKVDEGRRELALMSE